MPSPYRNILVLVDGTEVAVRAAEHAVQLAVASSARLIVVSVVDTETLRKLMTAHILVPQEVAEFEGDLEQSHRRHLTFVEQLARKAGVQVESVLRKGICHSVVLAEQKAHNADIIVVGSFATSLTKHDVCAHERLLIAEESPCPVVVVK